MTTGYSSWIIRALDDLDRLSAEQMKAMFKWVKANMDFPDVMVPLLFQRDIVEIANAWHAGSLPRICLNLLQMTP